MNLIEKAELYAKDKIVDSLNKTVTEAYIEGYKAGYRDCEDTLPLIYRDNKTEYVDLGLPSGTLWSADVEKKDEEALYLPYGEAKEFSLPTVEQCEELFSVCKFIKHGNGYGVFKNVVIVGPNGNEIIFRGLGYYESDGREDANNFYSWIDNEGLDVTNNMFRYLYFSDCLNRCDNFTFSGYKLPIRLVKTIK